jgi:hypothetical protein
MNTYGVDKGVTIRVPATANLMLDSDDRDFDKYPSPFDFQIYRQQNTQVGFFSRIGVTEVVLNWDEGNLFDEELQIDVSGATVRSTQTISFGGFGTVADVLDSIADISGYNGVGFAVRQENGRTFIDSKNGWFKILPTNLAENLGIQTLPALFISAEITGSTDLRKYRYVDITSSSLTYAQDLKDNSTATDAKDVLCRWYFSEDVPENLDRYGFPILMGYTYFTRRRLFNPPKQIKWDNNLPLGNLVFQVFDELGDLVVPNYPSTTQTTWYMTLQLSEN